MATKDGSVVAALRRSAAAMRWARTCAALFVAAQFTIYQPPEGVAVPFDKVTYGWVLAGVLLAINAASALGSARFGADGLRRLAAVELSLDTAIALAITWLFSFDTTSQVWVLLVIPVLEGALRGALRGAVGVSGVVVSAYVLRDVVFRDRYAIALPIDEITYLAGILGIVAVTAGLLARNLRAEAAGHAAASAVAVEAREEAMRHADDLRVAQRLLARRAYEDSLTGLANRARFDEVLEDALEGEPGTRIAVVFIDLDGFKPINDSYGHGVGDELLASVGGAIEASLARNEMAARFGGDEFTVLLRGVEGTDDVHDALRRIADAIEAPHRISTGVLHVTASLGATIGEVGADRPGAVLRRADAAMYTAKRDRGNRWILDTHAVVEPNTIH